MRRRLDYIIKHNVFVQYIYRFLFSAFFRFIGIFVRTDNRLVLFSSFGGRQYNDSPKVLFEHMVNDDRFDGFTFVWAFEEPNAFDVPKAKKVKIDTFKYFMTALKAKYWITSVNIERGLRFKKKNTVYLNTWHGTGPKVSGNGVSKRKDYDFSYVDILCCDGEYLKNIFIRDYNALEENVFFSGRPREDELYSLSSENIEEWRRTLKIPEDKKIILYAPTWRDSEDFGKTYPLDLPTGIIKMKEALADEYVLLLRTHIFTDKINGVEFDEFLRNVSDYPEVNHLYAIADILISDYSSAFFDYAILEKPMICFAYDYDEYVAHRGLYFDLAAEFPGGILRTWDSVVEKVRKMDYLEECRKTALFRDRFISRGENATELCVNKLIEKGRERK